MNELGYEDRHGIFHEAKQMKKVALVFVVAVLLPSLVLAWLALRSLRDQQFLLERQQSLLCQRVTDTLAQNISDYLQQRQQEFSAQVETLVGDQDAHTIGTRFDGEIRQHWPLAEVGFCVTRSGRILSPSASARDEAKNFYSDNGAFLGNREAAEVYGNVNNTANNQPNSLDYASSNSGGGSSGRRGYGMNSFGGSQKQMLRQSLALANTAASVPPAKEKLEFDSTAKKLNQDKIQSDQPVQLVVNGATGQQQLRKILTTTKHPRPARSRHRTRLQPDAQGRRRRQ